MQQQEVRVVGRRGWGASGVGGAHSGEPDCAYPPASPASACCASWLSQQALLLLFSPGKVQVSGALGSAGQKQPCPQDHTGCPSAPSGWVSGAQNTDS